MCELAQWCRRAQHDSAETIALVTGIKRSKPLLSVDHCSGGCACPEDRNPLVANPGTAKLLRYARPPFIDGPAEISGDVGP